jgi:hypothetical protein
MQRIVMALLMGFALMSADSTHSFAQVQGNPNARGKMTVQIEPAKNPQLRVADRVVREMKGNYQTIAMGVTRNFKLPHDLNVVFRECGEENAYYDHERRLIVMCDEFIAQFMRAALQLYPNQQRLQTEFVEATSYFMFFHELGHAVIQNFELPLPVNDEGNADSFAIYLLGFAPRPNIMLYAADYFNYSGKQNNKPVFWDVHPLDQQRFYQIVCLSYGSDPQQYAGLLKFLPKQRAAGCPEEFAVMQSNWTRLLAEHMDTSGVTAQQGPTQPQGPAQPPAPAGQNGLSVGGFILHPPQGSAVSQANPALAELQQYYKGVPITAQLHPVTNVEPVPSPNQLYAVMNRVNPAMTPIGQSMMLPTPSALTGISVGQYYQQPGNTGPISGLFVLHVTPDGRGIALDVFSPALSGNQNLQAVGEYEVIVINSLNQR